MRSRRSELGSSVIIVGIAFTILLTLALAGTTWAAPGAQGTVVTFTPTATLIKPCPGGVCTPTPEHCPPGGCPPVTETPPPSCNIGADPATCINASKSISVPVGAVPPGTQLKILALDTQPPCPASPTGQIFLDHCFKVDWIGPDGQFLKTFGKPVHDCLSYSASDLTPAGGNPANLFIGFVFGKPDAGWTLVKPVVEAGNSRVCADPADPFYYQALFTPKPTLPVTGVDWTGYYWLGLIALLVGAASLVVWRTARSSTR